MEYPDLEYSETTAADWIDFKILDKMWINGKDNEIEFDNCLWHPGSLQSGWLKIEKGEKNDFVPDNPFGTVGMQPDDRYVRAMTAMLYLKDVGSVRWTVSNVGNTRSWINAYSTFFKDINDNPGKVAFIKKTNLIKDDSGKGVSRYWQWEFVKWVDQPEDFTFELYGSKPLEELNDNRSSDDPIPQTTDDDDLPF
tara:strand:- start:1420 stop:2004 length:585 start_codon:yes stop_codon:yes gene_type:complete